MKIDFFPEFPMQHRDALYSLTGEGRVWRGFMDRNKYNVFTDVSMVQVAGKYIAWSCVTLWDGEYWIGCFTDPAYRRNGYGGVVTENTLRNTSHKALYFSDWQFFPNKLQKFNIQNAAHLAQV